MNMNGEKVSIEELTFEDNIDNSFGCYNCGCYDRSLNAEGYCPGCVCATCHINAGDCGSSMNDMGNCANCELPNDYEACCDCGFDHSYEYGEARSWHDAHQIVI